jgi:hypothetical protein
MLRQDYRANTRNNKIVKAVENNFLRYLLTRRNSNEIIIFAYSLR